MNIAPFVSFWIYNYVTSGRRGAGNSTRATLPLRKNHSGHISDQNTVAKCRWFLRGTRRIYPRPGWVSFSFYLFDNFLNYTSSMVICLSQFYQQFLLYSYHYILLTIILLTIFFLTIFFFIQFLLYNFCHTIF